MDVSVKLRRDTASVSTRVALRRAGWPCPLRRASVTRGAIPELSPECDSCLGQGARPQTALAYRIQVRFCFKF